MTGKSLKILGATAAIAILIGIGSGVYALLLPRERTNVEPTSTPTIADPVQTTTDATEGPTSTRATTPSNSIPPTELPTAIQATATSNLTRYSNSSLGFAVDHPSDWQVAQRFLSSSSSHTPPDSYEFHETYVVEFTTGLHPNTASSEEYRIQVFVTLGDDASLEALEAQALSAGKAHLIERTHSQGYRTVGGERAVEILVEPGLSFLPGELPTTATPPPDPGRRKILIAHGGQAYTLVIAPDPYSASEDEAQVACDEFLHTFTFIPITAPPTPPHPPISPMSTPTPTQRTP
jgi:hypothetical protein